MGALHAAGRQRSLARPLWQGMIEGKAGVTGSPDLSGAEVEVEAYFGASAPKPTLAHPDASSLLLVRAHAVTDGLLGQILDQLLGSGFSVGNLQMMQLTRPNAQEFLEVYKGVVPEYADWVEELISGKVVAVQVRMQQTLIPTLPLPLPLTLILTLALTLSLTRSLTLTRCSRSRTPCSRCASSAAPTTPRLPRTCNPTPSARASARTRSITPCTAQTCPRTVRWRWTISLASCSNRGPPPPASRTHAGTRRRLPYPPHQRVSTLACAVRLSPRSSLDRWRCPL